jgi:cyclophilin family peptidyl-prolyl cis-trans isomerase
MMRRATPRSRRRARWWLAFLGLFGCQSPAALPHSEPDAALPVDRSDVLLAIAFAADARRAADIPSAAGQSHDPVVRRARARALARILDDDGAPLLQALEDDDDEVVAWAAYGLGESCKGHEERASALAARLQSLGDGPGMKSRPVLLRAIGRCGGELAESALRPWLASGGGDGEAASFALGDVALRRGQLTNDTTAALLNVVESAARAPAALYPFSRSDLVLEQAQASRLKAAARAELERPGPYRLFAVRVVERSSDVGAASDLARLLQSDDALLPERIEAARALGRMKDAGQVALVDAVARLGRPFAGDPKGSELVSLLTAVVESLSAAGVDMAEPPLWGLARLDAGPGAGPGVVRRTSMLRCAAAGKLARGAWDSDVVRQCDVGDGEIGEHTRLDAIALAAGPLTKAARGALATLSMSKHPRVREAALDVVARRPEMADAGRSLLAQALASGEAGLVAKAATLVQAHVDRVLTLPSRDLDEAIASALRAALAQPWAHDLVETRAALIEAALATRLAEGQAAAEAACRDSNATLRARAAKALSSAGVVGARCPRPDERGSLAPEIARETTGTVRIMFDTDAGPLALVVDPVGAPIAVTRITALARSGFYTGTSFHRVVPGYVAQFGDRGGDGYGGAGEVLRCETSPIPFARGDVGMALAGRDTGSSQLFVTLARAPSLDGEYAWVGRSEGDWDAVVEGDRILGVRVDPP